MSNLFFVHQKTENQKMLRMKFWTSDFDVKKLSKRPQDPHNRIRLEKLCTRSSGLRSSKRRTDDLKTIIFAFSSDPREPCSECQSKMVSLDLGGVQEGSKEIQDISSKQAILESKMGLEITLLIGHRDECRRVSLRWGCWVDFR